MSEIKTDTNQMEDYNFELTSSGMEMSDGKNTITWGEDLLSQLAAAGDPVGQKYQELKSQGKSKVNLEDLSKPLAGVGEVVGVFLNQIQAKSNDTARKCQEISKTNEKYTTGINAVENAMSGEKNSVADEIVRNLISLLPDIGNITNIDFGKIWNNDILNDWESPQNANSNAVDKGKQDKIAEKNNIQSTIDNYEFELTENGNMLMKDGDSKQVWGSDLLKQLAKAGDPVGLKYQELINKKMVENGISNIGNMVGTFINTFVPANNQSTVNNKTNLKDNYYASLVGEDSHGNIMISNDYENKINDSVQNLISNGLSENDLRWFIDDTNAEVEKIREQIKSGKYNAKEIEEKKAQLKILGELSKQLSQSYNIVTSSDYEFEKNMSNYFLKGFYNPSELQKEIETNIRENQSILENDNSTLVEKCTASKNITALNNILYSMNDNLFDSKTNEKIDETANEFISKNINNYIKQGLSSADVDMILKNLKNQYKESVLNASQLNMNENDLINSLANNQLNLKEIELLTDVRKNLKEYERWETGCENELNFIFKDGITKEEKNKYISGNNNKIKEYKKQLKSGNLSETEIEIYNRKIDVLSQCNELVETNYNESVSLKKSLKEYERWETGCENELNFIFKDGITKEEKNKYISGNNNKIKEYKKQLKSGKLSETEIEICNKKIEVLSECNELVETNYNESVSLKRSLKEYETWTKECEDELNFIFKDGITKEEKNKYISGNNNKIKEYKKQLKSGKLSETEIEICNKKIEVLSECNELVENKYNKDLEYYQDLQLIDKYHENINRYKTEMHETSYGNSREFYQNLILVEESNVKELEEKWNIDSDEQAKNYAVKGYSEAKVKLSDLEKDKYKYTEDEYQKEYSAILSSMDDFSQQYTEIENKDTWKELISLKDTNKILKQQLANSTNSTEINQLNSVLNNNEFKISNLVSDLGLGNDYSISSKKSEISQLNNRQSILKKEIESLTKQANISTPKIRMEIEGQIEEKQRQYNANNLIIEQEQIKLNQLTNKKLTDACEFIDEELTNSYKEKNKFEVKISEELKNMLSKQTIVGPMQNSLLLNKTKNDLKIENLESLKMTYNELSKMNSDNSIEENINILLNKNMSDYNNASSEKNKNYIDNQVLNLYNIQKSFYENQGGEDANKKLQDLEIKVNDYWIKNHPVIEEDSRNYFEKIISGVGATVCQTGMTLWHGVENAAESVVDFAVTVGTGITSLGTSVIDLVNGDFGMPNSLTQNLYNDLDSFVATDWIGNAADSIYDTDFGKWVNDNSIYKRDGIVAGITRGVGEVAGKVAFASVLAGAAGTVGGSTTTATTGTLGSNSLNITKALSSTKVMQPLIAGITGYGQGMEDALNDGATHTDASTFATANAFWEAIQWKIGGKINEWTGSSLANSTSIAKNLGIFGASVAADTVDSAVEGFVQPGMKMLYNGKNFEQSFKDNGGWETVGAQAALGGIMSALGSTKDFVSSNKKILSTSVIDDIGKVSGNQSSIITASKVANPEWIASAFYKYLETNLTNDIELSSKAMNEGLLHFTSLENAQKIIDSGEIRSTKGVIISYGHNKAYMFAGIPSYSQMAINMKGVPNTVMTAVRIKPTDAQLGELKFRFMDDLAVSHKGKFKFDTNSADIAYFGVTRDMDGNLKYREITKEMADNYDEILAKEGINTKVIGNGNHKKTIVDGTGYFDAISKQLDVSKNSILKTMLAADDVANKVVSKVENISRKTIDKMEQGITSMRLKDSTNYDKVIENTMDSSIKSAKKTNINFDEVSSNSSKKSSGLLGNLFGLFNKKNQKIVGDISNSDKLVTKILYDYNKNISDIDYINSLSPSERLVFAQNRANEINSNPVISKLDIFKDNADETALSTLKNIFYENYLKNPEGTANFINNIVGIKRDNPNFEINFLFGDGSAADNTGLNIDNFSAISFDIAIHEFGHSLDINYRMKTNQSKTILPEFKNILENARKNCDMKAIIEYGKDSNLVKSNLDKTLLTNLFDKKATQLGTLDAISREFNNFCQNNSPNLKPLPDNLIKEIKTNYIKGNPSLASAFEAGILKYDYATAEFLIKNSDLMDNINVGNLGNELYNLNLNKYMNLYDPLGEFVSSIVLNGNDKPLKVGLNEYYYPTGHSSDYYEEGLDNIYAELFTEFNRLKEIGDVDSLNNIKTMFGEEFYNFFDKQTIKVNYYYHNN